VALTPNHRARRRQARDGVCVGCRTRELNTHSTESREVLYPWHPWHRRHVWIREVRTSGGGIVFRCGLEQNRDAGSLEIPQWMFDRAACARIRTTDSPVASTEALSDLKALLAAAAGRRDVDVVEAQHPSLSRVGGADATLVEATAAAFVSSDAQSRLGRAPTGSSPADHPLAKSTATRTKAKDARRQPARGGR
jgi:hypothetical protein